MVIPPYLHSSHRLLTILSACALSASVYGCDYGCKDTYSPDDPNCGTAGETPDYIPPTPMSPSTGYGEEQIGFRHGSLEEGSNDHNANAGYNSQESASAAPPPSGDYDEGYSEGYPGEEPEPEPEPQPQASFSAQFDEEALSQLRNDGLEWGFVYEGVLSAGQHQMSRQWWLNLGDGQQESGASLSISYADGLLDTSAQAYLGTSSAFRGPIQYEEYVKVSSQLELELPTEASEMSSLEQSSATVLIQETYQNGSRSGRALRERCVIAANDPEQSGEVLYSAQTDELISDPFISIASVTPLSALEGDDVSEEVSEVITDTNALSPAEGRCQCFDDSGEHEINCDDFDREIDPNLPTEVPFNLTSEAPLSTFSLDVDTASYTLVRQALNQGVPPDPSGVRVEEMINYFKYNYEIPQGETPFTVYTEVADCPWNPESKLAMIGLRGQEVQVDEQPPANLVYLLDVSGSMREEMWLIKPAFRLLTRQLRPQDKLSIVVYAGHDAVALEGVTGDRQDEILAAIEQLESGGSTAGEMGIRRAYQIATEHFVPGGNNRVILATDGDFNVGLNTEESLIELAKEQARSGVFLTVYGFSTNYAGNYQDEKMEQLSNHGNGTYFFIDGASEAQRAFMHSLSGTLLTIAKDVKIQVQFNPELVRGYRLIGYDNRVLSNRDFNDDSVDAGELGNGEEMTAFYELILADSDTEVPAPAGGQVILPATGEVEEPLDTESLMSVRMRYKLPSAEESQLLITPISAQVNPEPSLKFIFASTVAHFGLTLRRSAYVPHHSFETVDTNLSAFADADIPALNELRVLIEAARALPR